MFARRASSAFTCLRCELHLCLARQTQYYPTRRVSHQHRLYSEAYASNVDDASQPQVKRLSVASLEGDSYPISVEKSRRHGLKPAEKVLYPNGKIRGSRGHEVKEDIQPLEINSLGEASKVIILRDAGFDHPNEEAVAAPEESKRATRLSEEELLNSIANGKLASEQKEVNKELEALRPQNPSSSDDPTVYLSMDDYISKFNTLHHGYTSAQLTRYMATIQVARANKTKDRHAEFVGMTAWRPGTSPIDKRLSRETKSFAPHEAHGKRRLVESLLRSYWGVQLLEEVESIGEIEMRVLPWQHQLLTVGDPPTALDRIGRQRQARIVVYEPDNIIRITADRLAAQYVVDDVRRRLKSAVRQPFDLAPFNSFAPGRARKRALQKHDVEMIAKLSNTVIQVIDNTKLLIRAGKPAQAEDAIRSLLSLLDWPPAPKPTLIVGTGGKHDTSQTRTLHAAPLPDALPYRDRWRDLARWVYPARRASLSSISTTEAGSDLSKKEKSKLIHPSLTPKTVTLVSRVLRTTTYIASARKLALKHEESDETSAPRRVYWQSIPKRETSAIIGHILHPHAKVRQPQEVARSSIFDRDGPKSTFCKILPGLPQVVPHFDRPASNNANFSSNDLVVRLIPDPWSQSKSTPSESELRPEIRMQFRVDPDKQNKATFQGMFAILTQNNADVMLPHQTVDVRFTTSEVLWASKQQALEDQEIAAFVKLVEENVANSGVLRAPARLKLRIPEWTVKTAVVTGSRSKSATQKTTGTPKDEEMEVEYLFAELEHRQSVQFEFEQHPLSYAAVEAGKMGGHHCELRLWMPDHLPSCESDQTRTEGTISKHTEEALIEAARALAGLVNEAALGRLPLLAQPRLTLEPAPSAPAKHGDATNAGNPGSTGTDETAGTVPGSGGQVDADSLEVGGPDGWSSATKTATHSTYDATEEDVASTVRRSDTPDRLTAAGSVVAEEALASEETAATTNDDVAEDPKTQRPMDGEKRVGAR